MGDALGAHASQAIGAGSKSFATASRLFDVDTRRSAVLLYAWCRHCDDVIDGQQLGFGASSGPPDDSLQVLHELREATARACDGQAQSDPAFAALQEVVALHAIPSRYPFEHLDGFAMDVHARRYLTLDDTLDYCYHVAGVVGIMMSLLMGARDPRTLDRACDLGLAFQLTNIARDLVEDAAIGRCYLPEAWLDEVQLPRARLADPACRDRLAILAGRLVDAAEPYYASARGGLAALPLRSAWAVGTAHAVYRQIGIKVKAKGAAAWDQRVSTSRADKLRLLAAGAVMAMASRGRQEVAARPQTLWQRPR